MRQCEEPAAASDVLFQEDGVANSAGLDGKAWL
jgi:hypothetical protein